MNFRALIVVILAGGLWGVACALVSAPSWVIWIGAFAWGLGLGVVGIRIWRR